MSPARPALDKRLRLSYDGENALLMHSINAVARLQHFAQALHALDARCSTAVHRGVPCLLPGIDWHIDGRH